MGRDIHIRITKYNERDNLYHEIALYREPRCYDDDEDIVNQYVKVCPYSGRDYEMFEGMAAGDEIDGYGIFPWSSIKFNSYEEAFRNEIFNKTQILGYYDFHEISLAEMKVYVLENPFVVDYDADESEFDDGGRPMKINPISDLYDDIFTYIKFCEDDDFMESLGYYKIVFYFDC